MDLKIKRQGVTWKQFDGDSGRGVCVFATLNVVDKDGDVTLPGAFGSQKVKLVGAHDWHEPNIGFAKIYEIGNEAIAEFQFYTEMASGQEWYRSLKGNFENEIEQEFSYGYDPKDWTLGSRDGRQVRILKKIKVSEVSPVHLGAGENTRLLAMKSASGGDKKETKTAVLPHSTEISEDRWDGPAQERRVKDDESEEYYQSIYAWRDPEGDPKKKASWRFLSHEIKDDGTPGPANIQACITGIAVLNGGRGVDYDAQPWSSERKSIWNHLAAHMRDGDREPPELKSKDDGGIKGVTMEEQFALSVFNFYEWFDRERALAALKRKSGRTLSNATRQRMSRMVELLDSIKNDIETLMREADMSDGDIAKSMAQQAELEKLYAEAQVVAVMTADLPWAERSE